MRIAYVHDQLLPTNDTGVEQLINTISGFSHHGQKGLLCLPRQMFKSPPSYQDICDFYNVDRIFDLQFYRSFYPTSRVVEKVAHALRFISSNSKKRADILYTRNIPFFFAAIATGLPVAYETYRPWTTQYPLMAPLFRKAMQAPNFIGGIFHSNYARDEYIRCGIDASKTIAVHNGFDPRRFQPALSVKEAKEAIGVAKSDLDKLSIGYTGRLLPGKGMSIVLEMAKRRPEILFFLIGSDGEGEVEEEAKAIPNIRVFPWQNYADLPTYLFASDILLIPPSLLALNKTRNTVLPMKLFQYLAAGRPILAPIAPDTEELLVHQKNSFLVKPDDIEAACDGIDALSQSDELRRTLGEGALKTAEKRTWDARAKRILDFLEQRL